jgi:OmpA-like transmembrane domain
MFKWLYNGVSSKLFSKSLFYVSSRQVTDEKQRCIGVNECLLQAINRAVESKAIFQKGVCVFIALFSATATISGEIYFSGQAAHARYYKVKTKEISFPFTSFKVPKIDSYKFLLDSSGMRIGFGYQFNAFAIETAYISFHQDDSTQDASNPPSQGVDFSIKKIERLAHNSKIYLRVGGSYLERGTENIKQTEKGKQYPWSIFLGVGLTQELTPNLAVDLASHLFLDLFVNRELYQEERKPMGILLLSIGINYYLR